MAVNCCCLLAKALWGKGHNQFLRAGEHQTSNPTVLTLLWGSLSLLPGTPQDRSIGKEPGPGVESWG